MKRYIKYGVILLAVLFVGIQLIRPDFTNPPVVAGNSIQDSVTVPPDLDAIFVKSCNDCHSNKTVYPWYSQVAPASWFLSNHIKEGRAELNFSEWNSYAPKKKAHKLEEICEKVERSEMPLPSYLWIHRDAALTPDQTKMICDWSKAEITNLGPLTEAK